MSTRRLVTIIAYFLHCRIVSGFQPLHAIRSSDAFDQHPERQMFLSCKEKKINLRSLRAFQVDGIEPSFSALNALYHSQPYIAAFVTCSMKASAADLLAQSKSSCVQNGSEDATVASHQQPDNDYPAVEPVDVFRNLAFVLYGGFYQGMGQTFIYTQLFPLLFGSEVTLATILAQVSIDNFILAPFLCLPTVYTIKSLLAGGTPEQGVAKYVDHIHSQGILQRYWSVWFPVQCFNFGVIPEHLRVLFCAMISFFWLCLLSSVTAQEMTTTSGEQEPDALVLCKLNEATKLSLEPSSTATISLPLRNRNIKNKKALA